MAHQVAIDMPRFGFSTAEALERGRDVDTVRGFLGSQGPVALFDLPWMPLYLIFVYMLHPYLGALTFAGAFILSMLTIATELMTRRLASATHQAAIARNGIADSNARNADILKAMGFAGRAVDRFNQSQSGSPRTSNTHKRHQRNIWSDLSRTSHDPAICRSWSGRVAHDPG